MKILSEPLARPHASHTTGAKRRGRSPSVEREAKQRRIHDGLMHQVDHARPALGHREQRLELMPPGRTCDPRPTQAAVTTLSTTNGQPLTSCMQAAWAKGYPYFFGMPPLTHSAGQGDAYIDGGHVAEMLGSDGTEAQSTEGLPIRVPANAPAKIRLFCATRAGIEPLYLGTLGELIAQGHAPEVLQVLVAGVTCPATEEETPVARVLMAAYAKAGLLGKQTADEVACAVTACMNREELGFAVAEALHLAVTSQMPALVPALLAVGGHPDQAAPGAHFTPLMLSVYLGYRAMAQALVAAGADPHRPWAQTTAAQLAEEQGMYDFFA